jgi:hypothetical protein
LLLGGNKSQLIPVFDFTGEKNHITIHFDVSVYQDHKPVKQDNGRNIFVAGL